MLERILDQQVKQVSARKINTIMSMCKTIKKSRKRSCTLLRLMKTKLAKRDCNRLNNNWKQLNYSRIAWQEKERTM